MHDASAPPAAFEVEVRADPAFELLVGLSTLTTERAPEGPSWLPGAVASCSPSLQRALDGVGRETGEIWLHLLGLALEAPPGAAATFVETVARTPPQELRRHLVGVYVPSWRILVGRETLERAAAGDRKAIVTLLDHRRYYAGRARQSLELLLPLSAAETKRRVLAVLRRFADQIFAPVEGAVTATLEADAAAKRSLAVHVSANALITSAARGFVYEREPEASRVILVPQLAARPWLLLCQHRDARIICYPAATERDVRGRALSLGRALSDEGRIQILCRLATGDASLNELSEITGLAKSTAHHHLTQLRAGGFVVVRGNARSYRYSLRGDAVGEATALLAELLSSAEGTP